MGVPVHWHIESALGRSVSGFSGNEARQATELWSPGLRPLRGTKKRTGRQVFRFKTLKISNRNINILPLPSQPLDLPLDMFVH
jgi:hypothetical protein